MKKRSAPLPIHAVTLNFPVRFSDFENPVESPHSWPPIKEIEKLWYHDSKRKKFMYAFGLNYFQIGDTSSITFFHPPSLELGRIRECVFDFDESGNIINKEIQNNTNEFGDRGDRETISSMREILPVFTSRNQFYTLGFDDSSYEDERDIQSDFITVNVIKGGSNKEIEEIKYIFNDMSGCFQKAKKYSIELLNYVSSKIILLNEVRRFLHEAFESFNQTNGYEFLEFAPKAINFSKIADKLTSPIIEQFKTIEEVISENAEIDDSGFIHLEGKNELIPEIKKLIELINEGTKFIGELFNKTFEEGKDIKNALLSGENRKKLERFFVNHNKTLRKSKQYVYLFRKKESETEQILFFLSINRNLKKTHVYEEFTSKGYVCQRIRNSNSIISIVNETVDIIEEYSGMYEYEELYPKLASYIKIARNLYKNFNYR